MRLIDADALKSEMEIAPLYAVDMYTACAVIDSAPTIEAEPVRNGRWIFHEQKNGYLWKCSNCKGNFDQQFSYCPHCGCKMR